MLIRHRRPSFLAGFSATTNCVIFKKTVGGAQRDKRLCGAETAAVARLNKSNYDERAERSQRPERSGYIAAQTRALRLAALPTSTQRAVNANGNDRGDVTVTSSAAGALREKNAVQMVGQEINRCHVET